MTTSDKIALVGVIVFAFQALVFVAQTLLLWWYAKETKHIREIASKQAKMVEDQLKAMGMQNDLLNKQATAAIESLQFQKQVVEQEAIEAQRQRDEAKAEMEKGRKASLFFKRVNWSNGVVTYLMSDLKEIVQYLEIRTNLIRLVGVTGATPPSQFKRMIHVRPEGQSVIYFGIKYKTRDGYDLREVHQVSLDTSEAKEVTDVSYDSLEIVKN